MIEINSFRGSPYLIPASTNLPPSVGVGEIKSTFLFKHFEITRFPYLELFNQCQLIDGLCPSINRNFASRQVLVDYLSTLLNQAKSRPIYTDTVLINSLENSIKSVVKNILPEERTIESGVSSCFVCPVARHVIIENNLTCKIINEKLRHNYKYE